MSAIDDGGSAFPVPTPESTDGRTHDGGMSLRDYFAAAALTGLIGDFMKSAASNKSDPEKSKDSLVGACYHVADAMLAARKEDA